MPGPEDEIVVAMSSGVDLSVTAALYASTHKNVKGIYMANWSQTAKCTESDWNDVQRVCEQLKIPCERVNFEKEYWNEVFAPMVEMYERGLTPNPDLGCNRYIKFGKMIEHLALLSDREQKRWLATGHYARIEPTGSGACRLLKAHHVGKDQSYYLASISREVLPHVLMPLGHYTKPEVRELAQKFDLHTASKPDSVGLCFVSPDHTKFRHFLDEYIPPNPGNIITSDGKVWGTHQGIWHATIGQKLGISMPQGDPKYTGVWFVSEKRPETNEIVIVKGANNKALFQDHIKVADWRWYGPSQPLENLAIQYRLLQEPVLIKSWTQSPAGLTITLEKPQRAMAPGQSVVMYNCLEVVGEGVLTKAI